MQVNMIIIVQTLSIMFLGVISPGPDFVLVLRNSISSGHRAGILSAIGVAAGCLVSFGLVLVGLKVLFVHPLIKSAMSICCGSYLGYLGLLSWMSKSANDTIDDVRFKKLSSLTYLRNGFLTNILNPKLYTVSASILSFIMQKRINFVTDAFIDIGLAIMVLVWLTIVATVLSNYRCKKFYFDKQLIVNKVLGSVLIVVGIDLILHCIA